MASLLPYSVREPRMLAFEAAIDRITQLNLNTLSVYDIDNVVEAALYDLADQFNVLGNRGWNLAFSTAQKRQLIKRSIELHRKAGTPYSVKLALDSVGYPNIVISENPGLRYDGSWVFNGQEVYRGDSWGQFIVTLDPASTPPSQGQVRLLLLLIEEWKNLRSVLLDLRQNGRSLITNPLLHDERWSYDGTQTYDGTFEEI